MTKEEMQRRIAQLESMLASGPPVFTDLSKKVKQGQEKTCQMVIRGLHAQPNRTLNLYPSQMMRLLENLPNVLETALQPSTWDKLSFRKPEEKRHVRAFFEAYLSELQGGK